MKATKSDTRRRAVSLLSWYPKDWRDRYGEEFVELLVAELEEQPHSFSRSIDLVRSGLLARLAVLGFAGRSLDPAEDGRRSLAAFGTSISIFLSVAVAIWAQLTIGWQWSAPRSGTTFSAMVVMTVAMVAVALACVMCAAPVAWTAVRSLVRSPSGRIARPICLLAIGSAVLIVGTHHFANGWPGTYGHRWAHQGIVPGGVAAYAWASTLFVTAYWLHPAALIHFPTAEVVWMMVSPIAVVAIVAGGAKTVLRLEFSASLLRFERSFGYVIAGAMALFFTGASLWVIDGGVGPGNLFDTGVIDVVELAVMVTSLILVGTTLERSSGTTVTSVPH